MKMRKSINRKPAYGNWVSNKLLYISGILGVVFGGASFWAPILVIVALFFILCFFYFAYARYQFSPRGGNLQARIRGLVLDYLKWDGNGEALDIGCGNGPLAIEMAKKYKNAKVIGMDYWGNAWDYSQKVCEENAALEGVSDRATFQKASAAKLPYPDGRFDAVVSNFVFHEVAGVKNKRDLVKEALRVVKKGGVFAFQDLFLVKQIYGEPDDLLAAVKAHGVESAALAQTNNLDFIPKWLKLPFMVGEIGILYGKK
ncbi:MAG: class I SAM-dependent methyltransferase [Anaerolineales bacterium]|nr:class I SAM-dependent methyltransferase [Anaerolineales bacterium]